MEPMHSTFLKNDLIVGVYFWVFQKCLEYLFDKTTLGYCFWQTFMLDINEGLKRYRDTEQLFRKFNSFEVTICYTLDWKTKQKYTVLFSYSFFFYKLYM